MKINPTYFIFPNPLIQLARKALLLPLSIISVAVTAQDSGTTEDEEVFELSPFEVSTQEQIGYLANNTLAGTRINSELKNIANSVQVLTKEFIDDVGAGDFSELLIYSTGTEAYGVNGNASFGEAGGTNGDEFDQERARREPQLNTRVRGLERADLARDYFLSDIQFHPYIISEVTINRGPNASLFGLGSPGGIINSSVDKAMTDKSFGEINLKIDEFGTFDASLNYNQMVIEDKLAVRVAALDSNKRYEQEQAFYDEERYFAAATWRPMKGLVIRANYEEGEGSGSRPIGTPPIDGISNWLANGKPSYDPFNDKWYVNDELVTDGDYEDALVRATTFLFRTGSTTGGSPMAVFEDPTSPLMGSQGGYATIQAGLRSDADGRAGSNYYPHNGNVVMRKWMQTHKMYYQDPQYIVGAIPDFDVSSRFFYKVHFMTDRNIFDFRKNSVVGPSPLHEQNFEVSSIRAEKTFLNNQFGIEVAYQDQYWEATLSETKGFELTPDINLTLPDGSVNPNYGRPYVGNRGYTQSTIRDRKAFQAIGFAKLDFNDYSDGWLRHFGKHTLSAVYQDQERTDLAPNRMYARTGTEWLVHTATSGFGSNNKESLAVSEFVEPNRLRGHVMSYVGPSLVGVDSFSDATIQPVTALQVPYDTDNALAWNPFTGTWEKTSTSWYTYRNNPNEVWVFGNNRITESIQSITNVLQSEFLKGHLVTTVSWRKDTVEQATGTGPTSNGLFLPVVPELDDPFLSISKEQTSYGIVGHVPDRFMPKGVGLSFHYVDSQNFQAGVSGVDIFNRPGPLVTGVTEEYGFSIEAFDRKLYLRVNKFQTSQDNAVITGGLVQIGNTLKQVMENNSPEELAAAGWDLKTLFKPGFLEAIDFRPVNPNVPSDETFWTYTNIAGSPTNHYQDTVTEGVEIELSYAPTKNWRVAFNASSAEVEVSNVMKISAPELTRIANDIFGDPVLGELWISGNRSVEDGNQGRLRSERNDVLSDIALMQAANGGPLPEITKWRFNIVTNYNFPKDSALSGFGIGTGLRWQDAPFIGSAIKKVDGVWVPDYTQKYYGDEDLDIDAWISYSRKIFTTMNLMIQLRVRNVNAGSNDLRPVRADPDGTVRIQTIEAPRYFELSARLRF